MVLGELVECIELLQERIRLHRDALRESETRTRMALIDPLLRALGWDVFDPEVVIPEYKAGGGRADYALLRTDGQPAATVEAKKLGEMLSIPPDADAQLRSCVRHQVRRTDRWRPLGAVQRLRAGSVG